MAIPVNAYVFEKEMDPTDNVDFLIDLTQLLQVDETVNTFTLTVGAEGVALGLTLGSGVYAPVGVGLQAITFWLNVSAGFRNDAAYTGEGVKLPIEVTITTNSVKPRTYQRTVVVKVAQQ